MSCGQHGEVIVRGSRQPLVDGARELLARGLDPATLLTMRHQGKAYDSFRPAPIGEWAKWTYQEGEKRTLTRALWRPFADMRGTQKSGSDEVATTTLSDGRQNDSTVAPRVPNDATSRYAPAPGSSSMAHHQRYVRSQR